ncbi:pyrroline-5-carboxylate reductase family protein [Cupriavidus basilensis]
MRVGGRRRADRRGHRHLRQRPGLCLLFHRSDGKAASELGLTASQGRALAVETFRGAAVLAAQSKEPVSLLRERVTSKGGTTYAALTAMQTAGIGEAFVKAMHAAAARATEMGAEFGKD